VARIVAIPVVGSTVFSIIVTAPGARSVLRERWLQLLRFPPGWPCGYPAGFAADREAHIDRQIWLMIAIGIASAERTKFPTLTLATLIRPEIGARIVQ